MFSGISLCVGADISNPASAVVAMNEYLLIWNLGIGVEGVSIHQEALKVVTAKGCFLIGFL
jgi:hypothetical protein